MATKTLDRGEAFRLLQDSSTHGFVILVIALHALGDELFRLDFLEVLARLGDEFGGATLTEAGENRLQAMIVAMTQREYLEDPALFDSVCKSIATGDPDIGSPVMDMLNMGELSWALYELGLVEDEELSVGPEVQSYINAVDVMYRIGEDGSEGAAEDLLSALEARREDLQEQLAATGLEVPELPPLG